MGRYFFRLPDIGEGVAEAEITAWHIAVGDRVAEDQSLVDVMTDKATIEMTSPVSGTVVALNGAIGEQVAVGATLVELDVEGESNATPTHTPAPATKSAPAKNIDAEKAAPAVVKPASAQPTAAARPVAASTEAIQRPAFTTRAVGDKPLASPATRHRAYALGIPLQFVAGTGPGGRITAADLDAYISQGTSAPTGAISKALEKRTCVHELKIIGLRRKIAEKMQDAKRRIPHFSYVEEFDMTELEALRRELNEERRPDQPKLTLLPFFMRALVRLTTEFPQVNSRYDDEAGILHSYDAVHIGIATQTNGGLMVPVVRHAEALDIWGCARELQRVTTAAREGTAKREELSGSTITLTSLGTLGGIAATPIINQPEVAIIGPNKLIERPVVLNGQIAIRTMMNLSSSFDHRIVDGHEGARFVQRLKRLIERPAHLFLD